MSSTDELDHLRRTYRVDFPGAIDSRQVVAWFRQLGAGLHAASTRKHKPSIAFETIGTAYGTTHYITVPWQDAEHVVQQLHGHIQGLSANHVDTGRIKRNWTYAAEYHLDRPDEPLPLGEDAKTRWISILNSMHDLNDNDEIMLQWIVRPIPHHKLPRVPQRRESHFSISSLQFQVRETDKGFIDRRAAKNDEPNFAVSLRIAAYADSDVRAQYLVHNLFLRVGGDRGFHRDTAIKQDNLLHGVHHASSPRYYINRLTASELAALVGFPLGNESVIGVSREATRQRPPSASVLTSKSPLIENGDGVKLGSSTMAGRESVVGIDYVSLGMHAMITGAIGSGKTTEMSQIARQAMEHGHGLIIIDPKMDLFNAVIDNVPPNRRDDVIVIDFMAPGSVGFNILEQGNPHTVIDELVDLFEYKYGDKGVYFRQIMYHGLRTIAATPGLTFNDLRALISPENKQEENWARRITGAITDREVRRFWDNWWSDPKRGDNSKSTVNRIWQLTSRPETRYMLGQSKSSFFMDDVIKNNKILLVNVAGVADETKELIGTLLFNAAWTSAQNMQPKLSNLVMMDEFQMFADIPFGFDEVLALGRKFKFSVIAACQYPDQLDHKMQQAILNHARSKIVLNSEGDTARFWSRFFANGITDSDIGNLPEYVAMTRLKTPNGMSPPFTMKTLKPLQPYGSKMDVSRRSAEKYSRKIADIQAEEDTRRGMGRRRLSDEEAREYLNGR